MLTPVALVVITAALAPAAAPPAPAPPSSPQQQCQVFLRDFSADGLAPREQYLTQMLADVVATEISRRTRCRVTTAADVRSLIDASAERALCGDDSASCATEIGQALGVDTVVDGKLRVLGARVLISVRSLSVKEGAVLRRGDVESAKDADALRDAAPRIALALFGAPRAVDDHTGSTLTWSGGAVLGTGALVALAGGGVALWMNDELDNARSSGSTKEGQQAVGLVGVGAVAVGTAAALVGGGLLAGGMLQ